MRKVLLLAAIISCAAAMATSTLAGQPNLRADLNVGYYSGDYGSAERTDVQVVSPRLRWMLPRGEFRVSFPVLHVSSTGNVILIDGRPVAPGSDGADDRPGGGSSDEAVVQSVSGMGDVTVRGELDLLRGRGNRPWVAGLVTSARTQVGFLSHLQNQSCSTSGMGFRVGTEESTWVRCC